MLTYSSVRAAVKNPSSLPNGAAHDVKASSFTLRSFAGSRKILASQSSTGGEQNKAAQGKKKLSPPTHSGKIRILSLQRKIFRSACCSTA
jgi:hypothetical protein